MRRCFYNSPLKNSKLVFRVYEFLFHSAYSRNDFIDVNLHGANFLVPSKDVTILPGLLNNTFENELLTFLQKYLQKGMIFVDVGANIGIHSSIAARCVGETGKIFCFEPVVENYDLLLENVKKNIKCDPEKVFFHERIGISNEKGTKQIFLEENSIGTHSMHAADSESKRSVEILTTTLDDYFGGAFKIDVLKIDIEGHEIPALVGAANTLLNTSLLLLEFDTKHFNQESKINQLLDMVKDFKHFYFFDEVGGGIN